MKLSAKSDYAARAVLGLARRHQSGESVRVETLAAEQGVSANYLVQILIELKTHRLVKSVRGKEGGYLLARPPEQITMADVLHCFHEQIFESPGLTDEKCPVELRAAWRTLQHSVEKSAASINFQQLVERSGEKEKMYYI